MQDLQKAVDQALQDMAASGALAAAITKHVEKTVDSILSDALGRHSPFGKQLSEAVTAGLALNTDLGIAGYNQTVLTIIRRKLENMVDQEAARTLEKDLENLLSGETPREIKLSDLVKQFKEWVSDHYRGTKRPTYITADIKREEYGWVWISLDQRGDRERYECDFCIGLKEDGEVFSVRLGGRDPEKTIFLGGLYGFERTLFQLHAAKSKIIIDTDEPDTEMPPEECTC